LLLARFDSCFRSINCFSGIFTACGSRRTACVRGAGLVSGLAAGFSDSGSLRVCWRVLSSKAFFTDASAYRKAAAVSFLLPEEVGTQALV